MMRFERTCIQILNMLFSFRAALCTSEVLMGEFGVYDLRLTSSRECQLETTLEPVNANLAMLFWYDFTLTYFT